ncbi:hypothetical protein [Candidatus Parabeggiatoa sp. HSG14]|uniref:hypothetical protein n=1 Tax=Candidatus Parabeggiatoa sp. HSG14 TaxID=3055593 RepID=UPI0025A91E56|nr:hypothetical protein [Thiotrichales bacterium HSG14]
MSVYFKKNPANFLNVLFLVTLTFAFNTTASAELVKRAAVVEAVNGGSSISVFYVLRGEEKLKVFPTRVLQDGDTLWITQSQNQFLKEKQNYVTLTFGGGYSETVTYKKSPYLVKKRDTAPSIPENVIAETESWFSSLFKHYIESVAAIVRKDEVFPLSLPLLTKHSAKMVVGEHKLHLAWQGGNSPYSVQVFQGKAKKAFLMEEMSYSKRAQFKKQTLNAGHYRVVVDDAYGQTIEGKFQVVESLPLTLKQVEQEMKASTMSEPAKKTLFAAWLAQQEQGAWKFETYQRIAGIAKEYQPALLVRKELEKYR